MSETAYKALTVCALYLHSVYVGQTQVLMDQWFSFFDKGTLLSHLHIRSLLSHVKFA
jgi:hypothetical protein